MIVYFADRKFNIAGQASTGLPKGLTIKDDQREEDVETGIASFECSIGFDNGTRSLVERCATPGNYILRSDGGENEFYTITEVEIDTEKQEAYIYAEDAGLDLLNEIVGEYAADKAYPIAHYIEKITYDSGFEIGTNEVSSLTRKLSWDGEATITERLASICTQFDGAEVSYSFKVKGLQVVKKYINIHKKRGKDIGVELRLNRDIDRIITTKSITNLATALLCTGGTPEGGSNPINLSGYQYDDGDFFTDGRWLKSRKALEQWNRYTLGNGWIVKPFEYDTTDQKTLCTEAIAALKKAREMEVNYEVEISKLPDNARIGDRVNIVDDAGGLYLSARILKLKRSVVNQEHTAVIGEFLIKSSGISQRVADLATKFAQTAQSASRALSVATTASTTATAAKEQANTALADAEKAQQAATEAATAANNATQAAQEAQQKANDAQSAVDGVEKSVEGLQTTIANAEAAAEQARQAAETAETKATEAHTAAVNAGTKADQAAAAAGTAATKADEATTKAETAKSDAEQAKADAEAASTTAAAAKLDAENAQKEINSLGESLTTLSNTMSADYARKTDLTEATASLQTQITQNAAEISSTASMVQTIDETANNAAEQAQAAQTAAGAAQTKADQASVDALAAQNAANEATAAANSAQSEADAAKAAAATAKSVADKAEEDLEAAKADLETVTSRVDATEEEVEAAKQAVSTAQAAADKAKQDAQAAQSTADTAKANAATAQTAANNAKAAADQAQADATAAQQAADQAQEDVSKLAVRVTTAETNITQNSEAIKLTATKKEVVDAIGSVQVGGRNLIPNSESLNDDVYSASLGTVRESGRVLAFEADGTEPLEVVSNIPSEESVGYVKLFHSSKNLIPDDLFVFMADPTSSGSYPLPLEPGSYCAWAEPKAGASANTFIYLLKSSDGGASWPTVCYFIAGEAVQSPTPFTVSEGEQFVIWAGTNHVSWREGPAHIQIERGSSKTEAAPYAQTHIVEFSEPVSGGTYNWNTGVLTKADGSRQQFTSMDIKPLPGSNVLYSKIGTNYTAANRSDITIKILEDAFEASGKVAMVNAAENDPIEVITNISSGASVQSLNLKQTGKNLWNFKSGVSKVSYRASSTAVTRFGYKIELPAGTYKIHAENNGVDLNTTPKYMYGYINRADGSYVGEFYVVVGTALQTPTITLEQGDIVYLVDAATSIADNSFITYTEELFYNLFDVQIELGNVATSYDPYNGEVKTVTFDAPISGGTYNWHTGVLTDADGNTHQYTSQDVNAFSGMNCFYSASGNTAIRSQNLFLGQVVVDSPSGNESASAQFVANRAVATFDMSGIATIGTEYTFSFWIKSINAGSISVLGESIVTSATWKKCEITFTAEAENIPIYFETAGTYYLHHTQLEAGNKATDWTPAPEDMASTKDVAEQFQTVSESMAALQVQAGEISGRVASVEQSTKDSIDSVNDSIQNLTKEVAAKMTPEAVEVEIKKAMENGTEKVVTSTGYRFDSEGLTVEKSGSEMKTQITDNGMTVYQDEEKVLEANNVGVNAKNLHATTYLIVGANSRFEDYGNGRTGCFWIGG